jgi:hypothetical protein
LSSLIFGFGSPHLIQAHGWVSRQMVLPTVVYWSDFCRVVVANNIRLSLGFYPTAPQSRVREGPIFRSAWSSYPFPSHYRILACGHFFSCTSRVLVFSCAVRLCRPGCPYTNCNDGICHTMCSRMRTRCSYSRIHFPCRWLCTEA